jgi:hypothetical protein
MAFLWQVKILSVNVAYFPPGGNPPAVYCKNNVTFGIVQMIAKVARVCYIGSKQ